jgi:hypothetical protein
MPHLHGAPRRINNARKLGQNAIAGILDDPAPVFGDLRLDQFLEMPERLPYINILRVIRKSSENMTDIYNGKFQQAGNNWRLE